MHTPGSSFLPTSTDRFIVRLCLPLGSHPVPPPPVSAPRGALCPSLCLSDVPNFLPFPGFQEGASVCSPPAMENERSPEQTDGTHWRLVRAWAAGEVPEHWAIFRLAQMPNSQLREGA